MEIIETIIRKATFKGRELKFIYVKLDDGKWYKVVKTYWGDYLFKEEKQWTH